RGRAHRRRAGVHGRGRRAVPRRHALRGGGLDRRSARWHRQLPASLSAVRGVDRMCGERSAVRGGGSRYCARRGVLGGARGRRLGGRPPAPCLGAHRAPPGAGGHRVPIQGSAAFATLPGPVRRRDGGHERHPPRRLGRARPRRRGSRAARRLLGADPRPLGRRRGRRADSRGLGRRDDARWRGRRSEARLSGGRQPGDASLAAAALEEHVSAPLIECVPNFSEGRDAATLDALRAAITSVPGVRLLDVQVDPSHHRSVFTLVARPDAAAEAAFLAMRVATERIDLTQHSGEHPRMGATDVVPFVPVRDVTMDECVAVARRLADRAATELGIPIYLYARAATRPERERLPDIRKGEFEALRDRIGKDPAADPDFGPRRIHPTAGATAIGARPFLVAFNIYLDTSDVRIAQDIAKRIRTSSGGLPAGPGGGSAAALAAALAGALVAMVARLTLGRKAYGGVQARVAEILAEAEALRSQLRRLADDDAVAYTRVSVAYKLPKDSPARSRAVDEALVGAAHTPLAMARGAVRLVALAREIGTIGNRNANSDARVA